MKTCVRPGCDNHARTKFCSQACHHANRARVADERPCSKCGGPRVRQPSGAIDCRPCAAEAAAAWKARVGRDEWAENVAALEAAGVGS